MSDSKVSRRAAFGTGSIAAAMLMAAPGTAFAAEDAGAAAADEAAEGQIVVIGRGEEIDLATMRGPLIDAPQTINVVNREILDDRQATTLADAARSPRSNRRCAMSRASPPPSAKAARSMATSSSFAARQPGTISLPMAFGISEPLPATHSTMNQCRC